MSKIEFKDSGMCFSFLESDCYRIEDSQTHKAVGDGIKICECLVKRKNSVLFIEAKTSFSNPRNHKDFASNIQEIVDKLHNSICIYLGLLCDRPFAKKDDLPLNLRPSAVKSSPFKCYLIIRNHQEDWLGSVDEALNIAMKHYKKIFAIEDIKVLNEKLALKYNLIQAISSNWKELSPLR